MNRNDCNVEKSSSRLIGIIILPLGLVLALMSFLFPTDHWTVFGCSASGAGRHVYRRPAEQGLQAVNRQITERARKMRFRNTLTVMMWMILVTVGTARYDTAKASLPKVIETASFNAAYVQEDRTLPLRGAGLFRYLVWIKAYAGALYAPSRSFGRRHFGRYSQTARDCVLSPHQKRRLRFRDSGGHQTQRQSTSVEPAAR